MGRCRSRRVLVSLVVVLTVLVAPACATTAGAGADAGGAPTFPHPSPPAGEVVAQGTVLDTGSSVELCLGAIRESYPPQCDGIPLVDWSWDGVDGSESASGAQWGAYAVQGTYDGTRFAVTTPPVMLALYDPIAIPVEPSEPGATDEETLLGIQEELSPALGDRMLFSAPSDGRLLVDVVWDDGAVQAAVDEAYGAGVVVVRSALREIAG